LRHATISERLRADGPECSVGAVWDTVIPLFSFVLSNDDGCPSGSGPSDGVGLRTVILSSPADRIDSIESFRLR
jgi:hypothetical protein